MIASFKYIMAKRPTAVMIEQVTGVVRNKVLKSQIYDKWIRMRLG